MSKKSDLKKRRKSTITGQELYDLIFGYDGLNFCGCGDPESAIDLLRNVLQLKKDIKDTDDKEKISEYFDKQYALLSHDTNRGLYYTYLYFIDSKGLTEHGGSIGGSWLTEKGEELLEALNCYSSEEILSL